MKIEPTREAEIVEELAQHLEDRYAELRAGCATEAEAAHGRLAELSESELLARELRRLERPFPTEPLVLGTNRRKNMLTDSWQDLFNFLVLDDGSESLEGMWVTKDYFSVVGLQPVLGRVFMDSDIGSKTAPVIILGYDLWQRRFDGDPNIVGKTVRISRRNTPPTVIGVMPPAVRFLPAPATAQEPNYNMNAQVDCWVPASPDPERVKQPGWNVVGQLRSGAGINEAQVELASLVARQAQTDHDFDGSAPQVQPLTAELNQEALENQPC